MKKIKDVIMTNNNIDTKFWKFIKIFTIFNLNAYQILFAILMGIIGACLFLFLFPGGAISTAMHQILKLPGPGAGIGIIFGPFIILLSFLTYNFIKKYGAIFITCSVFGIIHSIFAPIVYPTIKTVGSLGPLFSRIFAVILLGLLLEICIFIFKNQKDLIRYPVSAGISNVVILSFYWFAIFPSNKGMVAINDTPILLVVTILAGVTFAGLIPLGIKRFIDKN